MRLTSMSITAAIVRPEKSVWTTTLAHSTSTRIVLRWVLIALQKSALERSHWNAPSEFRTGHRGSSSKHRRSSHCGISTSTLVSFVSHDHNSHCQSNQIFIPSRDDPTCNINAPFCAGIALEQYAPSALHRQSSTLPLPTEIAGWEANPSAWSCPSFQ